MGGYPGGIGRDCLALHAELRAAILAYGRSEYERGLATGVESVTKAIDKVREEERHRVCDCH